MSYRIKTVAEMTGIPRNTILAWERRYELLSPNRQANGYRVYSDHDISVLVQLKGLVSQGYKVSEAIALLKERQSRPGESARPVSASDVLTEQLMESLLALDRQAADKVGARLMLISFARAIDDVFMPVLNEIGERWVAGEVSIAQEHFASAWVRERLGTMLSSLGGGAPGAPRIVAAGFPGELHEVGLLASSVKLGLRGFEVIYLGADLPWSELPVVCHRVKPVLVVQSIVQKRSTGELLTYARELVLGLPAETSLVLGGPAVEGLRDASDGRVRFCPRFDDLLSDFDWARTTLGGRG